MEVVLGALDMTLSYGWGREGGLNKKLIKPWAKQFLTSHVLISSKKDIGYY